MKKILFFCAALLLASTSVHALVLEDWQAYATNTQITMGTTPSDWGGAGGEFADAYVKTEGTNNFARLYFSPANGTSPSFILGLLQVNAFSPVLDVSPVGTKVTFDLRTDLASAFTQVVGIQITADTIEQPGTERSFRTPDSLLQTLPASSSTWQTMEFLASDATFFETGVTWPHPDLTKVSKIEILLLQTVTDVTPSGEGVRQIDIDNFAVPEPAAMILFGFGGLVAFLRKRLSRI